MALNLSELEHQFMQDRISNVEHNVSELYSHFTNYAKRVGQMRDSGDELSECILKLTSKETLNHSLQAVLSQLADILCAVEDYRDAQAKRLDHKIIVQLSSYSQICKHTKDDIKKLFSVKTKELIKKQQLEKLRGKKPINGQRLSQAESEADKARSEAADATSSFAKIIDDFEKKRLENLKNVFLEFANIELLFHCKAVELYTSAYSAIKEIKIDEDLQEFRNHFKLTCTNDEVPLPPTTVISSSVQDSLHKTEELPSLKGREQMDDTDTTVSSSTMMSSKSSISNAIVENKDIQALCRSHLWNY